MGSPYADTRGGQRSPGAAAWSTGRTRRPRRVRSHPARIPHAGRTFAGGSGGDTRCPGMGIAVGSLGVRGSVSGVRAVCRPVRVVAGTRRIAGRGSRGVCRSAARGAGPGPASSRGVGPCPPGQGRVPSRCRRIAQRGGASAPSGQRGALGRPRTRAWSTPRAPARVGGIGQGCGRDDPDDRGG